MPCGLRRPTATWLALAILVSCGAFAQAQTIPFDPAPTADCLEKADPQGAEAYECVGLAAETCNELEGNSTYSMVMCYRSEKQWWELRLAEAYAALMVQHRADDAGREKYGTIEMPETESLAAMQRAWVAWRDASCDHARAMYGDGTAAGPVRAHCRMHMTARQALSLMEELRE